MRSFLPSVLFLAVSSMSVALCGCGIGLNTVSTDVPSDAISGVLMGGQQPITGATVSVYEVGTGGYGSTASLKASTTTDSKGAFRFASSAYTCTQNNSPMYLLSIGGNPGNSGGAVNPNAVMGASLGTCSHGKSDNNLHMNEVTTVALAYSLAQYFNTTLGGTAPAHDSFGGPSSGSSPINYARGIVLGNNYTVPLIANSDAGAATASGGNITTEAAKVTSLASLLAACVNSTGGTASDTTTTCGKLFSRVAAGTGGIPPTDTLQAAVQIALNPTINVSSLFNVIPASPAFSGGLSSAPTDWSIAVSYTTVSLGLGVDTNTLSTLDIDASNRIWFPSTAAGKVGIAYFDPVSSTFSGPYNGTSMVHPGQLAIDASGYAWVSDTQGALISGYNTNATSTHNSLSLTGTNSYTLTIGGDSQVDVGLYDSGTAKYKLANINSARSTYTEQTTNVTAGFVPYSIASDASANNLVNIFLSTTPRVYAGELAAGSGTLVANSNASKADFAAGTAYTGADLIGAFGYDNSGVSNHGSDGLCFYSTSSCYVFSGAKTFYNPKQIAVDGNKTVWFADNNGAEVTYVPVFSGTSYINSLNQLTSFQLVHNSSNGGTLTSPMGIGIDNEGNVWVANSGCATTGCTPGSFTLTEIIGAAAPTITPVSAQITSGNKAGTKPSY